MRPAPLPLAAGRRGTVLPHSQRGGLIPLRAAAERPHPMAARLQGGVDLGVDRRQRRPGCRALRGGLSGHGFAPVRRARTLEHRSCSTNPSGSTPRTHQRLDCHLDDGPPRPVWRYGIAAATTLER
ncbi:hypothetical protein BDA96_04G140300 [Sorghum bicolor]|uniref:Uncharacterized protein n=1 Tax=Sorghum bicolor TaxID=4558 RepID=A0A921UIZ2_SORBI|nr:hypothetical protein BDA96_04G140300 [Sorghum bicolor]